MVCKKVSFLLLLLLLSFGCVRTSDMSLPQVWSGTPVPEAVEKISANNARQLKEVVRWGKGSISEVAWSLDGKMIVWMSSTLLDVSYPEDMGPHDWRYYLASELWLMDADGSGKQRLTFFNQPGHSHQRAERTVVSDSAWGPDGKSLLVLLANSDGPGPDCNRSAELVLVTLGEE